MSFSMSRALTLISSGVDWRTSWGMSDQSSTGSAGGDGGGAVDDDGASMGTSVSARSGVDEEGLSDMTDGERGGEGMCEG